MPLEPGAPGYPQLLRAVPSPPALWVRGALAAEDALAVAIVGSRRATPYGLATAERIAAELAARGVTIVSGLARGIDTAAHRGALEAGGRTLAVLGCGIDIVYPPENRALITAGFAGDLGREVFAIPGRITSDSSAGTNRLIQDGAKLVSCWQDIVSELSEPWRRAVRSTVIDDAASTAPEVESVEGRMLRLLTPDEPRHIEELIARGGFDPASAATTLVVLELQGWVRQLAGQRWVSLAVGARRA